MAYLPAIGGEELALIGSDREISGCSAQIHLAARLLTESALEQKRRKTPRAGPERYSRLAGGRSDFHQAGRVRRAA